MRVKIGDTWYDSDEVPICVELTDDDKARIREMPANRYKYAAFPDTQDTAGIQAWMLCATTDGNQPTKE